MPIRSDNFRGAALMVGAMAAFTFNDACMKALGQDMPLFQALFLRGIGTTLLLGLLALYLGQLRLGFPRRDWVLVAVRTVAECGAAWFFITALFNMPLANVSAILQSLPLTVSLAGALVLGEAVGWRRLVAIVIGFCGVLLIVQPGTDGFTIHSVYALASVACVTVRDLAARRMSAAVPSMTVSLMAALGVLLFAGGGALTIDWAPVSGRDVALLGGATLFVIGGYICSVSAMRVGEIGFVAPFRYTSLLVALVLGVVIFGDFPDPLTLTGAAIVVATGLFTLWREMKARRGPPPEPLPIRRPY